MRPLGDFQLALAQRVHRRDQQLAGPERLDQVTVRPHLEGVLCYLRVVYPGDQDDRRVGVVAGDLFDEDQARLAGHLDVAESQIESAVFHQLAAGLLDAARELARIALAQGPVDQPQHLGTIVGGENAGALRACHRAFSPAGASSRPRTACSSSLELKGFSMKAVPPCSASACGAKTSWL